MKISLLASLFLFLLWGCASQPPLPLPTARTPLGPLQAQAVPEVYGLRIDVDRIPPGQDQLANDLKSAVSTAPSIDPSQYSWVGVNMGNGLFLDSNGNLAVNLVSLYHLADQFQILEKVNALIPYEVRFERSGRDFQRAGGGATLPDAKAVFNDGEIDLNFPDASTQPSIFLDHGVTYDGHGLMNSGQQKLTQEKENFVTVPALLGSFNYYVKRPDRADYGARFIVEKKGNILFIKHPGMLGNSAPIKYELTSDGCAFLDRNGRLHTIVKAGNKITYSVNGNVERTFEIVSGGTEVTPVPTAKP